MVRGVAAAVVERGSGVIGATEVVARGSGQRGSGSGGTCRYVAIARVTRWLGVAQGVWHGPQQQQQQPAHPTLPHPGTWSLFLAVPSRVHLIVSLIGSLSAIPAPPPFSHSSLSLCFIWHSDFNCARFPDTNDYFIVTFSYIRQKNTMSAAIWSICRD